MFLSWYNYRIYIFIITNIITNLIFIYLHIVFAFHTCIQSNQSIRFMSKIYNIIIFKSKKRRKDRQIKAYVLISYSTTIKQCWN